MMSNEPLPLTVASARQNLLASIKLMTTLCISRLMKSIFSSSNATQLGYRKMDDLVECLLQFTTVGHELLANVPVHQRFTAKEIDFQMLSRSAALPEKIQRALADFERNELRSPWKFPLRRSNTGNAGCSRAPHADTWT